MQENQNLHEEIVELSQEIEDLEQDLEQAYSDIAIILHEMKERKFDLTFIKHLKTQNEEE